MYAIRRPNGHADLVFHGRPKNEESEPEDPYVYQWRLEDKRTGDSVIMKGQEFESFILTTEMIIELGFECWQLYCRRFHEKTNEMSETMRVCLKPDLDTMIEAGVPFDDVMVQNGLGRV